MLNLASISHVNPLVDRKVKYFHDYFQYFLLDNSKKIDGFPENHLTYLEKMLFRVESLSKMHTSSRKTICNWLEQPEFDTNKDEFSKSSTIKPLIQKLKHISRQIGDKFDLKLFQETATKIIEELNGADKLNGTIYFYKILKSQISLMTCVHELEEHAEEIIKNARWLAAEYLRFGFDAKELSGLNSIFNRILFFEELKNNLNPHSRNFPLPPELKQKRGTKSFKNALQKFLNNNAFVNQFEGMLNALKETQQGDIYFRIDGVKKAAKESFNFSYGGVTFSTFDDEISVNRFKINEHLKEDFEKYFGAPRSIIAKIPVSFKSKEQAIIKAKYQTNRVLDALRYFLNDTGGLVSTNRVIIVWSNGTLDYHMRSEKSMDIHEHDLKELNKSSQTIPYPKNITNEVKNYLDRCNRVFFKGLACEEPDDMISHFWQYWETAFGFFTKQHKAEYMIDNLSLIISKKGFAQSQLWLGLLIHNYATSNNGNEKVGIPSVYYQREFDFNNPNTNVQEVKSYSSYPFIKTLIDRFESMDLAAENSRWHNFYNQFLWQLYEQRNFILHDGAYCSTTLEQLKFYFRSIVVQWKAMLFHELEQVPNSTIQEAIERLIVKSV